MTKISVIVPIYGVEKYLKVAIDSILNQTLTDLEIILIDDGGKDNCPRIIDEYAAKDSRIIAIHKQNGGYGQSMNVGLERATGEYIAILEPDDFIDSKMYEDLYFIAKKYNSDIVKSCFYVNLQTDTLNKITRAGWPDFIPEDKSFTIEECPFFLSAHPSVWSAIYKREFLSTNNIRFVEAPGAGWTDNPFQVQTMCLAERINYTSKSYYFWRKLHINDYDEIKDYNIPLLRTLEIHKWLAENNINSTKILENQYKRDLYYIKTIFEMPHISDRRDCYKKIKTICKIMNKTIISDSKILNKKEKLIYQYCKKFPALTHFFISYKKLRQQFRCRINSREIHIILFGKTIIRSIQ